MQVQSCNQHQQRQNQRRNNHVPSPLAHIVGMKSIHHHPGRSGRSYIDEGHWTTTLAEMKSGDYLLLQMGHNDGGDLGGAKPRGDLKGIGDDTQDVAQTTGPYAGKIETIHTFGWYLRKMIDDAKAKGVHPILLTPTIRNIWSSGPDGKQHIEHDMGYNDWVRQVAAQENIPVLELGNAEADRLEALGPEKTAPLFPVDHTHTSPTGANLVAETVAATIRSSNDSLSRYLKPLSQNSANSAAESSKTQ